jgi:hypothetical protein
MSEDLNLSIDPLKLDAEWVRHPGHFGVWAKKVVEAQELYDTAKSKFDLVKAELDIAIRSEPAQYDIQKVTEGSIASTLLIQPEYRAAEKAVIAAKKQLGLCNAAINSLEHKKRAMSLLVELFIHDYYAEKHVTSRPQAMTDEEKRAVRNRGRSRREQDAESGE